MEIQSHEVSLQLKLKKIQKSPNKKKKINIKRRENVLFFLFSPLILIINL